MKDDDGMAAPAADASNSVETKRTYCGICEASCGIEVDVRDNRILAIRPDRAHPNSKGFACSKGTQFHHVTDDPDRVRQPLRRTADGTFEAIGWDEALEDITARLKAVVADHGTEAIGLYGGNPIAWNYAAFATILNMARALGTKHCYLASSVDINNYFVVNQLLYGNNFTTFFPDIERTQFLLILGANPVVSHGSMVTVGHIREALRAIVDRGGRVVVLDPRRTETARLFEYVPIMPDSDAWLVAAMIRHALAQNLVNLQAIARIASGLEFVRSLVEPATLERAERETAIAADTIAALTRDFMQAPSATVYARWGASLGSYSTLTRFLVDTLNLLSGHLDRPGGTVLGHSMIDLESLMAATGQTGYDRWRTRVEEIPELAGSAPLGTMAAEIETPGRGQMRALIVTHGNPAQSGPDCNRLEAALETLDLLVSIDPYITETSRLAHFILPPTLWLEREGHPVFTSMHTAVPYAQWTCAIVEPPAQARDDWWIMTEICRRIGSYPSPIKPVRLLAKAGFQLVPRTMFDLALRVGSEGDLFGLRPSGLSRRKLVESGAPVKLRDNPPTGVLRRRIAHKDRLIHLAHPLIAEEMRRLDARSDGHAAFPMRIISVRELRSHNSWLHNVDKLMAGGRRQWLKIHPDDARAHGIRNGDDVRVISRTGMIVVQAWITDEMMPAVLGLPHGWGHKGNWRRATAAGGARFNDLTAADRAAGDMPSGQPQLTGLPVRIEKLSPLESEQEKQPCHS